jgi:hypothetical protein
MRRLTAGLKCALLARACAWCVGVFSPLACCVAAGVLLLEHYMPSLYIWDQRRLHAGAAPRC